MTDTLTASGAPTEFVDHRALDWSRVERVEFLLETRLRYEYPAPIRDLRHQLMVVPRPRHGQERRTGHHVEVSGARAQTRYSLDGFGNQMVDVRAARVAEAVEFAAGAVVERSFGGGPTWLPSAVLGDPRLLRHSPLARPDAIIREVARSLASAGDDAPLSVAERINQWVHTSLEYRHDVTGVRTTAAQALVLGQGVCQDYAHLMLALCRACRLPARYVSGHLLGEGGSHAWVEVVVAAPGQAECALAVPFDPTHGRRVGPTYLTVAVGRDYGDVAPTHGTYDGPSRGRLTVTKRLGLSAVHLIPA